MPLKDFTGWLVRQKVGPNSLASWEKYYPEGKGLVFANGAYDILLLGEKGYPCFYSSRAESVVEAKKEVEDFFKGKE